MLDALLSRPAIALTTVQRTCMAGTPFPPWRRRGGGARGSGGPHSAACILATVGASIPGLVSGMDALPRGWQRRCFRRPDSGWAAAFRTAAPTRCLCRVGDGHAEFGCFHWIVCSRFSSRPPGLTLLPSPIGSLVLSCIIHVHNGGVPHLRRRINTLMGWRADAVSPLARACFPAYGAGHAR